MTAVPIAIALLCACTAQAEVRRLVVIKSDGLPGSLVEANISSLPWIRRVFFENGARVANFYSRGLSVSAPSWAVLETGRNPIVRGNVEFDRYSLHAYDYLNFFPFYFRNALSRQVDTTEVEALDAIGIPLLTDVFPEEQTYRGFQLLQRGVTWNTLTAGLRRALKPGSVKDMVDEWIVGFQMHDSLNEEMELELIRKLQNPSVRYLDLFHTEFDHAAHLTNDRRVLLRILQDLDGLVGRLWTAIERSPLAGETALVLVSDHGMNNDPAIFGQGWNLVDALRSAAGGGHHVITNRHPKSDYKIKGLNPFVSEVTNESAESIYLKGLSANYPTAVVDLDGNERASVYLRNSDWNALQILHLQLRRPDLSEPVRAAATQAFQDLMKRTGTFIGGESAASLARLQSAVSRLQADLKDRTGKDAIRQTARLERIELQLRDYQAYLKASSEQWVPPRAMGETNSIHQLQNYIIGPAPDGLALASDGSLDWQRSFRRVDYFAFFRAAQVRNQPQSGVTTQPVDFVAVPAAGGVWLYKDRDSQALILPDAGRLRYLPIAALEESSGGSLHYSIVEPRPGLPLALFESLGKDWLDQPHTEREWLQATHALPYSNAVVNLFAQLSPLTRPEVAPTSPDERLLRDFEWLERRAVAPDMLILANDHWNFNVRSFNPGGNHGSFLCASSHATLMFAGGGVPRGLKISEPYDALSFAPTLLKLIGRPESARLPGAIIEELFPTGASSH